MYARTQCRTGRLPLSTALLWAGLFAFAAFQARPTSAQDRAAPSQLYFIDFGLIYDGDFADAEKAFGDELRGGIKTIQTRWIDSICYHTMCGEAAYYQGKFPLAMDHYNAAVKLFLGYPTFMLQVTFPLTIQPSANSQLATWGRSKRGTKLARLPNTMSVSIGKVDNGDVLQKGGVVQQAMLYQVSVQEIWRALTLSLHRRREILGPICPFDPLSTQIVQTLSTRGLTPANHWSESWVFAARGMALAGLGRHDEALRDLDNSLLIGGQYDHPLTPLALLQMGILMMEKGDPRKATELLEEASYAAADAGDSCVLEEAFRHAFTIHLTTNKPGPFSPLKTALDWAKQRKSGKLLQLSLMTMIAENLAVINNTALAGTSIDEVRRLMAKRQISNSDLGARASYVAALVQYQKGALKPGEDALASALDYKWTAGRWIYQIKTLDNLAFGTSAVMAPRIAAPVYEKLLRDPLAEDWSLDPLESLSVLLSTNLVPFEHWYDISVNNKQYDVALEIADRMRRRRFFSAIPGGGRLTALRWLLEGPENALDKASTLHRQDLLTKYPQFKDWSDKAKKLRGELSKVPLVPDSQEAWKKQATQWDELAKLSQLQETKLHEIAIRREPSAMLFPPLRKTKELQAALPKGHVALIFFQTSRAMHAYLLTSDRYVAWEVGNVQTVETQLIALLQKIGLYDGLREVPLKDLTSDAWKKPAKELLDVLVASNSSAGSKVNLADKFEELIVVPDGLLWYVPFEALQLQTPTGTKSLLSHCRIRYAPTMGLAVTSQTGRKAGANTAVVAGKMMPREEPETITSAFDKLRKAVPGAVALKTPLPAASSVYRSGFNALVVHDDLTPQGTILDYPLVALDKARSTGALSNWMNLPFGGPDYVLLPGFHTRVENGLKTQPSGYNSHDMFISSCALMAQGTRTILMSRWRTGGQSSYDLVREFAKELPHSTAADAWQRSVQLVTSAPLTLELEPRIPKMIAGEPPTADHPFFWSGYLVLDPGIRPEAN